jgi:hypothetical protein
MTDLHYVGGNNPAGTYLIRCAPVVGLLSLPTPATGGPLVVVGPPTFHPGYRWYQLYGTEGTKDYDEDQQNTDNGDIWSVSVQLFLPGDSAQERATLMEMVRHRFIVECQDNAGTWRRLGTKTENLKLTYKFGIDPQMGGRRGATLKFTGELTQCPPIVSGV